MQLVLPTRAHANRTTAYRTLLIQTMVSAALGFVSVKTAFELPLGATVAVAVCGALAGAFSIGVARGLIFTKRGKGSWDYAAMQPRDGSQLRPVPHVDWGAHGAERAFLHVPNMYSGDLRFYCSAQCLVIQGAAIYNLDVLRREANIWERKGGDLYAEFDQGPAGSNNVEGARVWASYRNGVSRIVVAYGGVNGEISRNADGSTNADPVLQAASSREWFEKIVLLVAPGDAELLKDAQQALATPDQSISTAYNADTNNALWKTIWILVAFFVFGTGINLLYEPVLDYFNLGIKDADRGGGALVASSKIANEWAKTSPHIGAESFKTIAEGVPHPASVSIEVQGSEARVRSSTDECVVRAEDDTYASVSCQNL